MCYKTLGARPSPYRRLAADMAGAEDYVESKEDLVELPASSIGAVSPADQGLDVLDHSSLASTPKSFQGSHSEIDGDRSIEAASPLDIGKGVVKSWIQGLKCCSTFLR